MLGTVAPAFGGHETILVFTLYIGLETIATDFLRLLAGINLSLMALTIPLLVP
jgi:hypothetical protein